MTAAPPIPRLAESDFRRISALVYQVAGIHLTAPKQLMVETRLRKRVEELELPSFHAYCEYLLGPHGEEELPALLDRLTTNKTDFFREPAHFVYLTQTVLPELAQQAQTGLRQPLAIWSAGCSSGEEPYTLAMVLSEYAASLFGRYRFGILATDISTRVLEQARTAIYDSATAQPVPAELKCKYLLRSKDPSRPVVRMARPVRELVEFRRLNLMDRDFGFGASWDVIFCRNVMIYFDKGTQQDLVNRFAASLRPGGYLFVGHSETLNGLDTPMVPRAPSVYRKPG